MKEISHIEKTTYSIFFSVLTISTIVSLSYIALNFSYFVASNYDKFNIGF